MSSRLRGLRAERAASWDAVVIVEASRKADAHGRDNFGDKAAADASALKERIAKSVNVKG